MRHVDKRQPYVTAVASYRSAVAQQLGCDVREIEWIVESTLYPEITYGGVGTCWQNPESVAAVTALWVATLVECTLLLAVFQRLERVRDELPDSHATRQAAAAAADPAAGSKRPRWRNVISHGEATAIMRTEVSSSSDIDEAAPLSVPVRALDEAPPPGSADIDVLVQNMHTWFLEDKQSRGPVRRTRESCLRSARKVFTDLFAAHLPWLAAGDAARLCTRLRRSCSSSSTAGTPTGDAAGIAQSSAGSFFGVFSALDDALKAVLDDMRHQPAARKVPTSRSEALSALEATEERLAAVAYEVGVTLGTITTDNPIPMRNVVRRCSAVTLGLVEYERLNLTMWRMLELSMEQKAALAQLWAAFRSHQQRQVEEFDQTARQLIAFPSAADLALDTSDAILDFAERMHHSDAALAGVLSRNASRSSSKSQELEFDPFTEQQKSLKKSLSSVASVGGKEHDAGGHAQVERPDWMGGLLGVSPHATDAAARLLACLREVQEQKVVLHIEFGCFVQGPLTKQQYATLYAGMFPYRADSFRIAAMASTEVFRHRVFERHAICG